MTHDQYDKREKQGVTLFTRLLNSQVNSFVAYGKRYGFDNALHQIDFLIKNEELKIAYLKYYLSVGEPVIKDTIKELKTLSTKREAPANITAGFFSKLWRNFVSSYAKTIEIAKRISKVNDTTKETVRNVLSKNLQSGYGAGQIGLQITKDMKAINSNRALLIARTELTHINGVASQYGAEQSEQITGVQLEKVWNTRMDGKERPEHASANGQAVDLKGKFIVGGVEMDSPGDPNGGADNVCNCRCNQTYRVKKQQIYTDTQDNNDTDTQDNNDTGGNDSLSGLISLVGFERVLSN
jgi:hypothetical protein